MTIQSFLDFLTGLDKGEVIYGSPFDANLRVDRKTGPFIIVYMVQNTQLDLKMGRYIPTYSFRIFFADRCPLNAKGEDIQVVVDQMMTLAINVLYSIKSDYNVRQSTFNLQTSWAKFDANLAGVTVEFEIKDMPYCLPLEPDEPDTPDDPSDPDTPDNPNDPSDPENSNE